MKEIWKSAGKVMFGLFVLALLVWAGNLTVHAVKGALPGDPFAPFLALALFDFGAFAWLLTFMDGARGTGQRTTALLLTIFDLAGVIFMSAGGLGVLSPSAVTAGLVVATALNYGAWYAYKLTDPETQEAIQEQNLEDAQFTETMERKKELFHTAMKQTKAMLDRDGYKLAAVISKRNYIAIKNQLNLELTAAERKAWEKDAIDAEAVEIDDPALLAAPSNTPNAGAKFGAMLAGMARFFGNVRAGYTSFNSTSQPLPQSSNANDQDQEL